VGVTAPAAGSEVLEIFATGLGPVSTAPPDGAAALLDILAIDQTITRVIIGGVDAQALFAGLAPGHRRGSVVQQYRHPAVALVPGQFTSATPFCHI
jgi:uncharacterized protein (TIGR03437 family)